MPRLTKRRFDALAGFIRRPEVALFCQEIEWYSEGQERVLGVLARDITDRDFSWAILGRDRLKRFRAVDLNTSIQSIGAARRELRSRLLHHAQQSEQSYFQGDEVGEPVDFFSTRQSGENLHPSFALLLEDERYSPARELIASMMRYHEDLDGNFVEQFRTVGFDARIWELYLFAALVELGYARKPNVAIPDFVVQGLQGKLGIEAVTANPPATGQPPPLTTDEERIHYLQNYIPVKLAAGLKRKLQRDPRYWNEPEMRNVPFVIAIQDFHAPGAMRMIVPAATEYVFGYRHSVVGQERQIERIAEHRVGTYAEPSGYFRLPESENVSAVLLNAQGTLMKFNRMGYQAGFGSDRVKMLRTGVLRREGKRDGPLPRQFSQRVERHSDESWIEGMVVLHNPQATIPLDPELLPGANHEFLQPDGRIMSLIPDFHPFFSQTSISIRGGNSTEEREG